MCEKYECLFCSCTRYSLTIYKAIWMHKKKKMEEGIFINFLKYVWVQFITILCGCKVLYCNHNVQMILALDFFRFVKPTKTSS